MSTERVTFGAGCFWGVEATFRRVEGVVDVVCGYSGGPVTDPSYEDVCTDRTGHAEVVQVTYDTDQVSFEQLLAVFWESHDPTTPDRQGEDEGSQYRSCIFCYTREQGATARLSRTEQELSGGHPAPIVTEILPAAPFYRAEERHQRYVEKRDGAPR